MARKRKQKDLGRYASGLEKYCGDSLKAAGLDFEYEQQFTIMEGFNYPSPYFKSTPKSKELKDVSSRKVLPITYKPDFYLPDYKTFIETKGWVRANDSFPLRWKIFMNYLLNRGMGNHALFIPKNKKQVDETIKTLIQWNPKN